MLFINKEMSLRIEEKENFIAKRALTRKRENTQKKRY